MSQQQRILAFSLVELSIVLVILGLLVGGILAGQSLIRAGELRAATSEFQRYSTAVNAFRDKYFAMPGDMTNATGIWGKDAAACNGQPGGAGTPGTCNGDGDGILHWGVTPGGTAEYNQFWKQLALAGLVEGTFTGLTTTDGNIQFVPGLNAPASKASGGAAWSVIYQVSGYNAYGSPLSFDVNYGNALWIGNQYVLAGYARNPMFTPEEAWNIDTKMDDGQPASGKVIGEGSFSASTGCTNAASTTDWAATYSLANKTIKCTLMFPHSIL